MTGIFGEKRMLFFDLGYSENARRIDLPHDAMLESTPSAESRNGGNTGYRDGDVYIYVKRIFILKRLHKKH